MRRGASEKGDTVADKELEILSRLQTTLNEWTIGMSEIRSIVLDSPSSTVVSEPAPQIGAPATETISPAITPDTIFHSAHTLATDLEAQNELERLQAEHILHDSLMFDSQKEIAHLTETLHNLGEELRTLRLDAARDRETRLALGEERDESRHALEALATQLSESHAIIRGLEIERREDRHDTDILRADLSYARATLIVSAQDNAALAHERAERHQEDLRHLALAQDAAAENKQLREEATATSERLANVVQALRAEQEANARVLADLETARFGQIQLQEQTGRIVELKRDLEGHVRAREEATALQGELDSLKREMAEEQSRSESRVNLEIALRAEIESLRSVLVEKDFVLNYMQQELNQKNAGDLKDYDLLQDALEGTVRWRDEVAHHARESQTMQKQTSALKDSLTRKESELDELNEQLNSLIQQVADRGAQGSTKHLQHELQEQIEALRTDTATGFRVMTHLKRQLEPWLTRSRSAPKNTVPESGPAPDEPISGEEPSASDTVRTVLDVPSPPRPMAGGGTSEEVEDDLVDPLQINAEIQQRVEQFYARHQGARLIQWGRVLALVNIIALVFWAWAAEFSAPQSWTHTNAFHVGFAVSATGLAVGCIMVLAGVRHRR